MWHGSYPVRTSDNLLYVIHSIHHAHTATSGSAGSDKGDYEEFKKEIVLVHNDIRAKHGSPALRWDDRAAKAAQQWADELARTGDFRHGNYEGMGQNLFYNVGPEIPAQKVVEYWYGEIRHYDFNRPGFDENTGHFTQVVWADTEGIGIGVKVANNRKMYVVANYTPPGNVQGGDNFRNNVRPLIS